jgi:CHAT domain-containing protein
MKTRAPLALSLAIIASMVSIGAEPRSRTAGAGLERRERTQERASTDRGTVTGQLVPGGVVERRLTSGDRHSWSVRLRAGDYLELTAESPALDLVVSVYGPTALRQAHLADRQPGPRDVALVARASGDYRVDIATLDAAGASGDYRLRIEELRAASPLDRHRAAAAALCEEAGRLRDAFTVASLRSAAAKYQQAILHWKSAGELSKESLTWTRLADTQDASGHLEGARRSYLKALAAGVASRDAAARARALNGLSHIEFFLGERDSSKAHGDEALQASRTAGDAGLEAAALNNLGDLEALAGRTREALTVYAQALEAANRGHDRRQSALALLNLGYSHSDLSETDDALGAYGQALAMFEAVGDRRQEAVTYNAFGHLYSKLGDGQRALEQYRQAAEVFQRMGDARNLGVTFNGMGHIYLSLGEKALALEYYQRQLAAHRATGFKLTQAAALGRIGYCQYLLGRPRTALQNLKQSLAINRAVGNRNDEAYVLGLIGLAYEASGLAEDALRSHEAALALTREIHARREEAYALNRIARLLHRLGRTDEALERLDAARRLSVESQDPIGQSLTLYNIAVVTRDQNRLDDALGSIRESLDISESLRANVPGLDLRSSFFAEVRDRHELLVTLLMRLHAERPGQGFEIQAFDATEKARARSLLDGLAEAHAGIREGIDQALLDRQQSIGRMLNAAAQRLAQLRATGAPPGDIAFVSREVDDLNLQRRNLDAEIRTRSPRFAEFTQARPLTLGDVQTAVVDDGSVLLEYFLGAEESYVWTVTPDHVRVHILPPRQRIEDAVRHLRAALADPDAPATTAKAAAAMAEMLLQPVVEDLGKRRLLIVPDGVLHLIPFAALPDPGARGPGDSAQALIAQHEIVHLPSPSTLALLRSDKRDRIWPKTAIVFGDPVFEADDPRIAARATTGSVGHRPRDPAPSLSRVDLRQVLRDLGPGTTGIPRLLGSRHEAEAIAKLDPGVTLALGFAASRAAVTDGRLSDYRIVHFATHGIIDNDRPELSGIVLSLMNANGVRQDGFLRLHDIYNLALPVDLVVLSACSTAVGKEVRGEGLVGLVRGFMYAGSHRVLASLWKVDDEATSALMTGFYRGMLERHLGPAAALRDAQLGLQRTRRWRHPFYWAGFVLQGDAS